MRKGEPEEATRGREEAEERAYTVADSPSNSDIAADSDE